MVSDGLRSVTLAIHHSDVAEEIEYLDLYTNSGNPRKNIQDKSFVHEV